MNVVSVQLIDTEEGRSAVVMLGGRTLAVRADQVAISDGTLQVVVPAHIEAPEACTQVVRFRDPQPAQLRLAVERLDGGAVERLLLQEQLASSGEPMGTLVKRAVGRALQGETGEP